MNNSAPKGEASVLIGVLSAGEPSLPRAMQSIESQDRVACEILHIRGLPSREAHSQLFSSFSSRTSNFDILVKVDADMELLHQGLICALAKTYSRFPSVDQIEVGVDDWLSGEKIWGLNSWRGGTRWKSSSPSTFNDRAQSTARKGIAVLDCGVPVVLHAAQPTENQCLRYGVRRALKAAELPSRSHLRRLIRFVEYATANPSRERMLVLAAIDTSLRNPSQALAYIDEARTKKLTLEATVIAESLSIEELGSRCRSQVQDLEVRSASYAEKSTERSRVLSRATSLAARAHTLSPMRAYRKNFLMRLLQKDMRTCARGK